MKWQGRFTVSADHPSLPGHFPGHPVVPGVVILDEVVAACHAQYPGRRVTGFAQVKFLSPLRPAQTVNLLLEQSGEQAATFECRREDRVIATGQLRLAPGEPR